MLQGLFFAIIIIIRLKMKFQIKVFVLSLFIFINHLSTLSKADNHNIYEALEEIQKNIKTLEKAVYSGSIKLDTNLNSNSSLEVDNNNSSEDVLTRHLLKLTYLLQRKLCQQLLNLNTQQYLFQCKHHLEFEL